MSNFLQHFNSFYQKLHKIFKDLIDAELDLCGVLLQKANRELLLLLR